MPTHLGRDCGVSVSVLSASAEAPSAFRGAFRVDPLARSLYAEGAGIARALPAAVAVPVDVEDLALLVRWARAGGYGLIPRGSGSGMAGGAVGTGVIVDLSRFTAIGEVDVDALTIRVGTGALRNQVDAAARGRGLSFPVNPSSGAFCTIGGMIAANAAGSRTLRYGATRGWVRGVRCVFEDGSEAWVHRALPLPVHVPAIARLLAVLETWRAHGDRASLRHIGVSKESSGYGLASALEPDGHLVDLLVGSEGTLALFLEADLALTRAPAFTASVLAAFPSLERATSCAVEARDNGASACELLDRTFLDVAGSDAPTGISQSAEAVLLFEVEGDDAQEVQVAVERIARQSQRAGAFDVVTAIDKDGEHRLWALRHAASPILSRMAPRVRSMQFIEDGCVPPEHFPTYVLGVRAALSKHDTPGVIFGHAGDAHAHVNPLVDVTRSGWRDRVRGLFDDVSSLTARLGGTLAGEHGDGRLRAPQMTRMWSASARAAFTETKRAADPHGVLNRGCKVVTERDLEGDAAIGVIKYDPEAAPIDPRARVALDDIERSRAWHRFRLAMVESGPPTP
jgi:FAD/FMN-containing dehydrogenase